MSYQKRTPGSSRFDVDLVEVADVPFRPPTAGIPFETFTLASLVARQGATELARWQRIHFELFVVCRSEFGHHEVDFEDVELRLGRILHVRPGQVHRWILEPRYEAQLIIMLPVVSGRSWAPGHPVIAADAQMRRDVEGIVDFVASDDRETPLSINSLEAIRELLISLLALDAPQGKAGTQRDRIFVDFQRLLGNSDVLVRTVEGCARDLGCSTRTLTRACHEAAGASPKHLIDQVTALEAQRRLSIGNSSATEVAESLGFLELSHFSRFFLRVTGETPSAFMASFP